MTPSTEPTMKPPTVSSIVTRTCSQSGPRSVPSVNHRHKVAAISEGCDQKNLSITPMREPSSHPPRTTTATSTRPPSTLSCRRPACCRRDVARSGPDRSAGWLGALTGSSRAALLTLIAHQDLIAEVLPDLFVNLDEARLEANLRDVARPREVDLLGALPGAGARGDVSQHGLPGEVGVGLEDVADSLRDAGHRLAEDVDLALAWRLEARDEGQGGRFAASSRADHRAELARVHTHVQVVERRKDSAGRGEEPLGHPPKLDGGGHASTFDAYPTQLKACGRCGRFGRFGRRSPRAVRTTIGSPNLEDAASSRLPDPRLPGRDHPAVSVDRGCGRRVAGKPGAASPIRAALARDRRIGRQ